MSELLKTQQGFFEVQGIDGPLTIGIAGKAVNTIEYNQDFEIVRKQEKSLIQSITGIPKTQILMLDQVHGDEIIRIDEYPQKDSLFKASADGMISNIHELCLVIRTADCVPVFAFDKKNQILGAVHSGWRGCKLEISRKLVKKMMDEYSSKYQDISVFILPSIGPDSYVVNDDVALLFPGSFIKKKGKKYLDLVGVIEKSLIDEGIRLENINNYRICTLKENNEFFSYRNRDIGRNLNFCYIRRE